MACTGMKEIFMDRRGRRHFRSVGWFPLFALTVILANLPTSTQSSDGCTDGEYRINELATSSPGMINTEMTTNSMTETTVGCRLCNITMKECIRCELSNNSLVCQNCSHGYQLTDDNRNCTLVPDTTPEQSDSKTIIIAVVVSVGCVIIIVAIIVGIVFAARNGKLEKCHCACARSRSPTPPPMPSADDLGVSFKKDDNESGTGQRVDLLRYTEEPGVPQNRVESVHYDGYIPREDDDDVYQNDMPMANIPATVQEEEEDDDELYVNNTGFSSPANQSNANTSRNTTTTPVASSSNTTTTPVASSIHSKPPRPKPKPQTPAKPTSATKPKLPLAQPEDNRVSIFPPEDPDEIYSNEQELKGADDDDEDDKEDYVNAEDYEPGKR